MIQRTTRTTCTTCTAHTRLDACTHKHRNTQTCMHAYTCTRDSKLFSLIRLCVSMEGREGRMERAKRGERALWYLQYSIPGWTLHKLNHVGGECIKMAPQKELLNKPSALLHWCSLQKKSTNGRFALASTWVFLSVLRGPYTLSVS